MSGGLKQRKVLPEGSEPSGDGPPSQGLPLSPERKNSLPPFLVITGVVLFLTPMVVLYLQHGGRLHATKVI